LIDGTTQGNIAGSFTYSNIGNNTLNLSYNFNGTPGIAPGSSFFSAIRIA